MELVRRFDFLWCPTAIFICGCFFIAGVIFIAMVVRLVRFFRG